MRKRLSPFALPVSCLLLAALPLAAASRAGRPGGASAVHRPAKPKVSAPKGAAPTAKPVGLRVGVAAAPVLGPGVRVIAVPAVVSEVRAHYEEGLLGAERGIVLSEVPVPGRRSVPRGLGVFAGDREPEIAEPLERPEPAEISAGALAVSFNAGDFNTNPTVNGGFLFIPPDSHGAAGPAHVINIVNCFVQWWNKDGTSPVTSSLAAFFSVLGPLTATFDPKVLYDQYAGRWLIVTLEQTDTASGDPANTSRLFAAVSDDSNPNGTWFATQINSRINIGGVDRWLDYPGFAVDEEAVYVTGNMFGFGASGTYGGVRLFVINKGISGGFYGGGAATASLLDPYAGGGIAATTQPAHVFDSAPAGEGTYLLSYSGLTDNVSEYLQFVRIDNPLGSPTFTQNFVDLGDIEDNPMSALVDAPQSGSAVAIEVNDRRTLNAVWRGGIMGAATRSLWLTFTMKKKAAAAEPNQTTAAWARLDTSTGLPVLAELHFVGGEDIASGTETFFPSIAVNDYGEAVIGFSASAASIFAGSYYTCKFYDGTTCPSTVLRPGTDFYVRTFGGASNRWGDYSGAAVDPADGCLWLYNQHAMTRGTPAGGDGRWATAFGMTCLRVVFADGFDSPPSTARWSAAVP